MLASLPRASGVYQIRCIPTGKIYVGSTVDIRHRCAGLMRRLRGGKHPNRHLQYAWQKYGEDAFEFLVLELVPAASRLQVEQRWIEQTRCADKSIGFNIYDVAGSPGTTHAREWVGFIEPHGKDVTITNLFEFCHLNNLDFPSMHRLAMGRSKLKSYRGWTHKHCLRKREHMETYEGFISPTGEHFGPVTKLAAFCRENGLDNTHTVALTRGRICSFRGWTYTNGKRPAGGKLYTGFVSPEGQQVVIANLTACCIEHDLSPVRMHALIQGTRKSHKGWTWRNSDEQAGSQGRGAETG